MVLDIRSVVDKHELPCWLNTTLYEPTEGKNINGNNYLFREGPKLLDIIVDTENESEDTVCRKLKLETDQRIDEIFNENYSAAGNNRVLAETIVKYFPGLTFVKELFDYYAAVDYFRINIDNEDNAKIEMTTEDRRSVDIKTRFAFQFEGQEDTYVPPLLLEKIGARIMSADIYKEISNPENEHYKQTMEFISYVMEGQCTMKKEVLDFSINNYKFTHANSAVPNNKPHSMQLIISKEK